MIIGINGPIGSGKNEVARILEEKWGFKAIGFADKLKESAAALFPDLKADEWNIIKNDPSARVSIQWGEDIGDGRFQREISISGRDFLKRYGTEAHRDVFGYDFWVEMLLKEQDSEQNIAIYDARFDNELKAIKALGGKTIQVRRPEHEFDPTHPSETAPNINLIDYLVHNHGTLEDLEWKVNVLVKAEKLADQGQ